MKTLTAICIIMIFMVAYVSYENEKLKDDIHELKMSTRTNEQVEDLCISTYCVGWSYGALAYQNSSMRPDGDPKLNYLHTAQRNDSVKYHQSLKMILK